VRYETICHSLLMPASCRDKGDREGTYNKLEVPSVAWQHINFYGHYEFTKLPQLIDMKAIVQELALLPVRLNSVP
jgi:hypothetical protein